MELIKKPTDIILRKGYQCDSDSYSVFFNNGHIYKTVLDKKLKKR